MRGSYMFLLSRRRARLSVALCCLPRAESVFTLSQPVAKEGCSKLRGAPIAGTVYPGAFRARTASTSPMVWSRV